MVSINIGASTALLSKKQSSTYYNTPAGVFCTRLVSAPAIYAELNTEVIFARLLASAPPICELGEAPYQNRHGGRWIIPITNYPLQITNYFKGVIL